MVFTFRIGFTSFGETLFNSKRSSGVSKSFIIIADEAKSKMTTAAVDFDAVLITLTLHSARSEPVRGYPPASTHEKKTPGTVSFLMVLVEARGVDTQKVRKYSGISFNWVSHDVDANLTLCATNKMLKPFRRMHQICT